MQNQMRLPWGVITIFYRLFQSPLPSLVRQSVLGSSELSVENEIGHLSKKILESDGICEGGLRHTGISIRICYGNSIAFAIKISIALPIQSLDLS